MNITDELRKWNDETTILPITRRQLLDAIADRIDAEHEKALEEQFKALTTDMNLMTDEEMAAHGWVRGPLDADGVMWHEGDMSDSVWGEIELIVRDIDGHWYIKGHDTSAPWVRADSKRHYHEPTVEDVLREFGEKYCDTVTDSDDEKTLFAEYAAKLQLRGDGE